MKHDRDFDLDDEAGAELDEETRQVLAALREAGRTPAPPAGFVNQLNAQLRQEYEMKDKTLWSQFRRWLPAAVGAGVMMAVVAAAPAGDGCHLQRGVLRLHPDRAATVRRR